MYVISEGQASSTPPLSPSFSIVIDKLRALVDIINFWNARLVTFWRFLSRLCLSANHRQCNGHTTNPHCNYLHHSKTVRFSPPIWRKVSTASGLFLQLGGRFPSQWFSPSNLEEGFHRNGFRPPIWRKVSTASGLFLQFGGRFQD